MTPAQCRAARGLLDWSQEDLATRCAVSRATVAYFERGKKSIHPNHVVAMQQALEGEGIEFIAESGDGGSGVRFKRPG